MKAPYYIRVSTVQQAEKGWSLPEQLEQGKRRYQADDTEWDDALVFWDDESGRTAERGGFQEYIQEAISGRYERAYVHAVDRFGRSLRNNLEVKTLFDQRGVALVSVAEPFDFGTDEGDLVFKQLSTYSEFFSRKLAKEIRKGKRGRASAGYSNATFAPYGYRRVPQEINGKLRHQFVPDDNAVAVRQAFEMYATGRFSYQEIADHLNAQGFRSPGRRGNNGTITLQSVRQWLINPFYQGDVVHRVYQRRWSQKRGKLVRKLVDEQVWAGQHEPLVSRELFAAVQAVAPTRYNAGRSVHRNSAVFPLGRGRAVCSACGEPLQAGLSGGRRYYRCTAHSRGVTCPAPQTRIRADDLEATLEPFFASVHLSDAQIEAALALAAAEGVEDIPAERARLQEQRRRLSVVYSTSDVMTDAEYRRQDGAIRDKLAELDGRERSVAPRVERLRVAAVLLRNIGEVWARSGLEQRREIARATFQAVRVDTERRIVSAVRLVPEVARLLRLPIDADVVLA